MMPWACFVCGSMSAICGHREPDLIEWAHRVASQPVIQVARQVAGRRRSKAKCHFAPGPVVSPPSAPPPVMAASFQIRRGSKQTHEYSALRGF
jgi:hypothetical protein